MNGRPTGMKTGDALIVACFFFSGAAGLMYEIIWTRFLNLTFGCTTYSITTVLTAFMSGLALGSLIFGRIVDKWNRPLLFYGIIEASIGFFALFTVAMFSGIADAYLVIVDKITLSGSAQLLLKFGLSFLVMLVPTTLMGASLPVLSKYFIQNKEELSRKLGMLYAVNTFGAVLGTFLVGFTFLYTLGLKSTILFAAVLNMGIGLLVLVKERELRKIGQEFLADRPENVDKGAAAGRLNLKAGLKNAVRKWSGESGSASVVREGP